MTKIFPSVRTHLFVSALALVVLAGSLQGQENFDAEPIAGTSDPTVQPVLGTGNFARSPFRISVSVREGYDDNVNTSSINRTGSFFTDGSVDFDYKLGNARTQLALRAFGGLTYYYTNTLGQDYDITSGFSLTVSHQATPRLGLAASVYLAYQSQPDFNSGFGINRRSGNYFYTANKFSVSYQWAPKFSTVTSYTLGALYYDDSSIALYEDRLIHTFGNEFRFLVLPTTSLVAEYRYQIVDFDTDPRDSVSHFFLGGLDHSFNPRFNISVRAGVEFREFEDFGERTSPYAEATLNYALSERSTLSWNNRYGLDQPDVPGAASRHSFRTGLRLNYAFTPRFSSIVSIYYQHDDNEGLITPTTFFPSFTEDSLDLTIGLRYEINRTFAALAGYSHTEIFSDIPLREYSRNRYYLGLSATF